MNMPTFDDTWIDRTEIDLTECLEMRIRASQHVKDRPALIGDSSKWRD
jgi:hypothetical protein